MINKKIHYCWFGDAKMPEETISFIQEWKQLHAEWEFYFWNEANIPLNTDYIKNAKEKRHWANMSNYIRLYALFNYGGVYLDTDIKLIKSLDEICNEACFWGFEDGYQMSENFWVNNAICGAVKGHEFIKDCLNFIVTNFDGLEQPNLSGPRMITTLLKKLRGLSYYGYQKLSDLTLFPKEYFYPIHYTEVYKINDYKKYLYPETIAVHFWSRSWLTKKTLLSIIDELYKINFKQSNLIAKLPSANRFINETESIDVETQNRSDEVRFSQMCSDNLFLKILIEELQNTSKKIEFKHEMCLKGILEKEQEILSLKAILASEKNNNSLLLQKVNDNEKNIKHLEQQHRQYLQHLIGKVGNLELIIRDNSDLLAKQKVAYLNFNNTINQKEKVKLENIIKKLEEENAKVMNHFQRKDSELSNYTFTSLSIIQNQSLQFNNKMELVNELENQNNVLQNRINEALSDLQLSTAREVVSVEKIALLNNQVIKLQNDLDIVNNQFSEVKSNISKTELNNNETKIKLTNQIKYLNSSNAWYEQTFEKRSLGGILKDRIYKKIDTLGFFDNWSKGYNKIKRARISLNFEKKILCSVVNYNCSKNANLLRNNLSKYFDTVVFDSGSYIGSKKFVNLGNVYYSGLLNNAYKFAKDLKYDFLFFICSDVEFCEEEIEKMIASFNKIDLNQIGLYSPASTGRSHIFCKKIFDNGLRSVPFVEGFVFMASLQMLDQFLPVSLHVNRYGWGLDVAGGYFARQIEKLSVIDDGVTVHHPESTGYSNEKAEYDMWHWVEDFPNEDFKRFFKTHIDIIRLGKTYDLKVSVIVPCYNQSLYLTETLYSILQQEYTNFEIIVVNDGSTDDTEDVIENIALNFPQIKYYCKKNAGLGNTRNFGLQVATGDLIQFLDADDLLSKDKFLNQIYTMIKKPDIEVSYSPYICFEDGNPEKTWIYSRVVLENDPIADLIQNWEKDLSIPVHCFLLRKEIVNNIRFDEELPNHEDWLFHLSVAALKPKYHFEDRGIAYYRVRNNSMARDRNLMLKGKEMCIQKAIGSGNFDNYYNTLLSQRLGN